MNTLIVWDWNGTLLDDMDACIQAMNQLLEKRNLPLLDLGSYRNAFSFPVIDYYRAVGFDLRREKFEDLAGEYIAHYRKTAQAARLQEGATELVRRFKDSGRRQIILSAMETAALQKQIGDHGLSCFFEDVVGADNIQAFGKTTVAERYFRGITNVAGMVLIGDTFHDFEVARGLGCRCVLVRNGHQNLARFQFNHETRLVDGLPDLIKHLFSVL